MTKINEKQIVTKYLLQGIRYINTTKVHLNVIIDLVEHIDGRALSEDRISLAGKMV